MCRYTSIFCNMNTFRLEMVLCPKPIIFPLSDFIYILKFKWYSKSKIKITCINTIQKWKLLEAVVPPTPPFFFNLYVRNFFPYFKIMAIFLYQ